MKLGMSRSDLRGALDFAVDCADKMAALWIIRLCAFVAILLERLRMTRQGYASPNPTTSADTERLREVLQGEPEYDQQENMAGAAAAVIERQREAFKKFPEQLASMLGLDPWTSFDDTMLEVKKLIGASNDSVRRIRDLRAALRERTQAPLDTWNEIVAAVRACSAAPSAPDAVPVLRFGDIGAHSALVFYRAEEPEDWHMNEGDTVRIGQWRYSVVEVVDRGAVAIRPLDGAPVIPTGDGLTIARVPVRLDNRIEVEPIEPLLDRLAQAIDGEVDRNEHVIEGAITMIERLKDERARGEQRRLDLAEKMALVPSTAGWDVIATHAELYGLLSIDDSLIVALCLRCARRIGRAADSSPGLEALVKRVMQRHPRRSQ